MRVWVVCSMLALVAAAGCAESPEETMDIDHGEVGEGNATLEQTALPGRFVAGIDATNITAGMPFNVTLDYVDDNATDATALAWSISFFAEANGTDGDPSSNATAGDGNGTAGNETGGNATAGNATATSADGSDPAGEVIATYNGTGLPATVEVNLTRGGNVTLAGTLAGSNATAELEEAVLTVIEDLAPADPCAGAPVQEPIVIEDIFVAVAVDGTGLYQGHGFDLEPCQTLVFAEIESSEAYLDPMLRLKDHTGAEVDAEDNEFLYHDTLTYEPGGYLEPGTWQIDARGYVGAPGNYVITLSFAMPE